MRPPPQPSRPRWLKSSPPLNCRPAHRCASGWRTKCVTVCSPSLGGCGPCGASGSSWPSTPATNGATSLGLCRSAAKARPSSFYCPTANQQYSRLFLQQLAAREPEAVHVILWDGAGFHPGQGAPELPANVRLIALPPYSPELNPVEKLWDQLKDRLCNQPFPTLTFSTGGVAQS
jgi:DDE superfamily endonuclease